MQNRLSYALRRSSRARRMKLSVHGDGALVITVPSYTSQNTIEAFVVAQGEWIKKTLERFKKYPRRAVPRGTRTEFLQYKEKARILVQHRLVHFNQYYGFPVGKVSIRNTKSRWGSCSKAGNLNFNYKVVLLPAHLADYVIVHELCHIGAFNHSPKFWDLVAKTLPNHKALRRELRTGK